MVGTTVDKFGRLDYAFNNAGCNGSSALLAEQTLEDWDRVIAITLSGVFYGLKYQIPAMLASGGGAIVNTSSTAGLRGSHKLSPYAAAKHGVNGLTKSAALEYGTAGIRVNSLCPGGTRTQMLESWMAANPGVEEHLIGRTPIGRIGEPREMAEVVVWLCSPASSYVTGLELAADGGMTAL
jgi:NAD(P)-dependent dehydrogenase (short-subunit alcohol dehydrogenase family)